MLPVMSMPRRRRCQASLGEPGLRHTCGRRANTGATILRPRVHSPADAAASAPPTPTCARPATERQGPRASPVRIPSTSIDSRTPSASTTASSCRSPAIHTGGARRSSRMGPRATASGDAMAVARPDAAYAQQRPAIASVAIDRRQARGQTNTVEAAAIAMARQSSAGTFTTTPQTIARSKTRGAHIVAGHSRCRDQASRLTRQNAVRAGRPWHFLRLKHRRRMAISAASRRRGCGVQP